MRLSVIIVSWNTCELLDRCLTTLFEELTEQQFFSLGIEVFVVDNASGDGSAEMVRQKHSQVRLISNAENLGFGRANNQALTVASGQYILLLNPDTEICSGSINTLVDFLDKHSQAGVVAPQLINSDGSIQLSCRAFPSFAGMFFELVGLSRLMPVGSRWRDYKMLDWPHNSLRQVDQPEGACLLIRKVVLDQVGIFDEDYFMLFEEVDWCYRVKQAGWEIWFIPDARIIHHMGQAIKQVKVRMILSSHKGMYRFWYKHHRHGWRYLDGIVYGALMLLAYIRVASYWLRKSILILSGKGTMINKLAVSNTNSCKKLLP